MSDNASGISDEVSSYNENIPIVNEFLEDSKEILDEVNESMESICNLETSTALSRACVMNNVKLYNDCECDTSVNEAILRLMRLYVKNRKSKSGLQRTVTTVCSLLPKHHNCLRVPFLYFNMLKIWHLLSQPFFTTFASVAYFIILY